MSIDGDIGEKVVVKMVYINIFLIELVILRYLSY